MLFLENYESGYASLVAKTFDIPVSITQDQLRKLENAGVLISRLVGRTRLFEFNPWNPTAKHLRTFLADELNALPESITQRYFRERQRVGIDAVLSGGGAVSVCRLGEEATLLRRPVHRRHPSQ